VVRRARYRQPPDLRARRERKPGNRARSKARLADGNDTKRANCCESAGSLANLTESSRLKLPIAIHKDDESVYGVIVPDIPGVHSWGKSVDDAIANTKHAIVSHLSSLAARGQEVSVSASTMESLTANPDFDNALWVFVDVDLSQLDTTPEAVSVDLPFSVLRKIDAYLSGRKESRDDFFSRAALEAIANG
jgi:predicted RNase H-like HicB family nuclease